ncbi:hypothetical protein [Paenibacillus tyrfis]|uniref:hypothetical protein n=1 Tax=Paenibacillus tyrfis TaxID=1501230 RepID=UPI000B594B8F|nr:hypothetical protein [Paenibacillus tyrfis]
MVKKIGCFITGAWTEAGAMTSFLKKINSNYEYIQLLPNKPKYKRGLSPEVNGFTGDSLIKEIYRRVERYGAEYSDYSAFIIEDDTDYRFYNMSVDEFTQYKANIQKKIEDLMKKEIPVFFLYASPEIEAWFLCDWDNSFSKVYQNDFFVNRLRGYIDKNIVKDYWKLGIEKFGINDGTYRKLSDEIMAAAQIGVKQELEQTIGTENIEKSALTKVQTILSDRSLYYSKRDHGDQMLRFIYPENLLEKCSHVFAPVYRALHRFSS